MTWLWHNPLLLHSVTELARVRANFVLGNVWIIFIFNLMCSMHPPLSRASYHCLCHVCSHNRLGLWLFYSHLPHRHFEWNNSDGAGHLRGSGGLSVLSLLKKQTLTCPFAANLILQHFIYYWNIFKYCNNLLSVIFSIQTFLNLILLHLMSNQCSFM